MALQRYRHRNDDEDPFNFTDNEEEEESSSLYSSISTTVTEIPMETPTDVITTSSAQGYPHKSKGRPQSPGPFPTSDLPDWPRPRPSSDTSTWITQTTKSPYAYGDHYKTWTSFTTPALIVSTKGVSSTASPTNGYGGAYPDGHWPRKHTAVYAAASIVPIIVLAIVGGILFCCLRKRRRQRQAVVAAQMAVQEMKMRPQPTVQPYLAPTTAILPQYTATPDHPPTSTSPSEPPPVILGPIPSGANGAYLTGIDTSDVVSVTSNDRQVDPFSDSNLAEPPPPYRPRSAAPPSFVSASRQSSFRAPGPLPATSQTLLIERSPFEDSPDNDTVSDLSGPTIRREEDAMSVVSDLSYQHDPVIGRSSL